MRDARSSKRRSGSVEIPIGTNYIFPHRMTQHKCNSSRRQLKPRSPPARTIAPHLFLQVTWYARGRTFALCLAASSHLLCASFVSGSNIVSSPRSRPRCWFIHRSRKARTLAPSATFAGRPPNCERAAGASVVSLRRTLHSESRSPMRERSLMLALPMQQVRSSTMRSFAWMYT